MFRLLLFEPRPELALDPLGFGTWGIREGGRGLWTLPRVDKGYVSSSGVMQGVGGGPGRGLLPAPSFRITEALNWGLWSVKSVASVPQWF